LGHVKDVSSFPILPEPEQVKFSSIEDHTNLFCPAVHVNIAKLLLQDFTIQLISNATLGEVSSAKEVAVVPADRLEEIPTR
jgi:hypothetical protein